MGEEGRLLVMCGIVCPVWPLREFLVHHGSAGRGTAKNLFLSNRRLPSLIMDLSHSARVLLMRRRELPIGLRQSRCVRLRVRL